MADRDEKVMIVGNALAKMEGLPEWNSLADVALDSPFLAGELQHRAEVAVDALEQFEESGATDG